MELFDRLSSDRMQTLVFSVKRGSNIWLSPLISSNNDTSLLSCQNIRDFGFSSSPAEQKKSKQLIIHFMSPASLIRQSDINGDDEHIKQQSVKMVIIGKKKNNEKTITVRDEE